jgi:hypothetical protein
MARYTGQSSVGAAAGGRNFPDGIAVGLSAPRPAPLTALGSGAWEVRPTLPALNASTIFRILIACCHTTAMSSGRHLGHRAPSTADRARVERANRVAANLAPVITELRQAGVTSLKAIARALDERHVPTPAGSLHWHPMQVARLLKRLPL